MRLHKHKTVNAKRLAKEERLARKAEAAKRIPYLGVIPDKMSVKNYMYLMEHKLITQRESK